MRKRRAIGVMGLGFMGLGFMGLGFCSAIATAAPAPSWRIAGTKAEMRAAIITYLRGVN
jgi:hypothetical protein